MRWGRLNWAETLIAVEDAGLQPDPTWKGIYRLGGIGMMITGPLYFIGAILSIAIGPALSAGESYLQALAGHITLSQINLGIFILSDFLLLAGVLALYLCLRQLDKNVMLIAGVLLFVYLFVDLAVTQMSSAALVNLAQQYQAAAGPAQRAVLIAAASYPLASLPLATFFSFILSSAGYLIVSLVMLKGLFSRLTAIIGIILSGMGILGSFYVVIPVLYVFLIQSLVGFGVWALLVGYRLYHISRYDESEPTGAVSVP